MIKSQKSNVFVNSILHISGILLCIVPPTVCTLLYFPLWFESGSTKSIAGGAALLLVLCAMPIFKLLKQHLVSPASYVFWLIAFIVFSLVSRIAYEMTVITFVGFVSNAVGAVCFAFAKRYDPKRQEVNSDE
ncbi:MAG: hypothetical protein IJW03_04270 [Clostridia bacterium]|nr:hypothetical protein [Clostridia bacterium]